MRFSGFQKLTLLDYPGRVACTLFTAGCNLLCPFCHNASLVTHIDNSVCFEEEEILDYLKKRRGILDGVCITGGEPLLQNGLEDFIAKVKELGYSVKLDTNGTMPDKLISLVTKGLVDYVAMDIKNCKEKYPLTVGKESFDISRVEKSVAFLLSKTVDYEFRTTIVQNYHTPNDIESLCRWISGAKRYFLQNFVDSGDLIKSGLSPCPKPVLEEMLSRAKLFVQNAEIRGL